MNRSVTVPFRQAELGSYHIVSTPPELKATGYLGDLAILDTQNWIAYPINANAMFQLMNGRASLLWGVQLPK